MFVANMSFTLKSVLFLGCMFWISLGIRGAAACDCNYTFFPGGCYIKTPAPAGKACKCSYKGAWTCGGQVVPCSNENSYICKHPKTTVYSCIFGGGDCDGYLDAKCDCYYRSGGCKISKSTGVQYAACRCKYKGWWKCGGSVVKCTNPASHYCKYPDKSLNTCKLGGGDCGGY